MFCIICHKTANICCVKVWLCCGRYSAVHSRLGSVLHCDTTVQCSAVQCRAGQGRAGQCTVGAGQGRAGQGSVLWVQGRVG